MQVGDAVYESYTPLNPGRITEIFDGRDGKLAMVRWMKPKTERELPGYRAKTSGEKCIATAIALSNLNLLSDLIDSTKRKLDTHEKNLAALDQE